jgi:hypothetical protein
LEKISDGPCMQSAKEEKEGAKKKPQMQKK